jgi:hypothetical protein
VNNLDIDQREDVRLCGNIPGKKPDAGHTDRE